MAMKFCAAVVAAIVPLVWAPIFAQQATVPHEFQAGTPALASEVNENFSDLDTRVGALVNALAAPRWKILDATGAEVGVPLFGTAAEGIPIDC